MKTSSRFQRWVVVVGCLGVLGLQVWVGAEPQSRPFQGHTTDEEMQAKQHIEKQLDEILEVQAAILARYDELMEELVAVKARASR